MFSPYIWRLNVTGTAASSLSSVKSLSSVYPSVRPSLSFPKVGSLFLSDIVHDDSCPWYPVTDETRFLKKQKKQKQKQINKTWKKKGYGTSSATLFSARFLKIFFTLCCINWPNFTVWLSLLLELWTNMCIVITCYANCDVQGKINVLAFLSSHSSPWQIHSGQKFKYLKKEKSF